MSLITTDKLGCRLLVESLNSYGIRDIVVSPGSRNVPLIMAAARCGYFRIHEVIDERSAAFIGLGIAEISGLPVALICTSGTALLNYAPAVAEAYYQQLPLIVVSADRPREWIDQLDSQTIRQPGALSNIVRDTISIKAEISDEEQQRYVNRLLNQVLSTAIGGGAGTCSGPVHINVAISTPLNKESRVEGAQAEFHRIHRSYLPDNIPVDMAREYARRLYGHKVLIVAGCMPPSAKLTSAMARLASLPGIAIVVEGLANIHAGNVIQVNEEDIKNKLSHPEQDESLRPDILVYTGGAIVSGRLKQLLRRLKPEESWRIGADDNLIDTFMSLTEQVEISADGFFPRVAGALGHLNRINPYVCHYSRLWTPEADKMPVCDDWWSGVAVKAILKSIPSEWNLQLSNGLSVRLAERCPLARIHRVDCNRGVSGIDGSTSTALGASLAYGSPTLLISGDMSFQYDLAALSSTLLSQKLKMVVLSNGGGGIFHSISSTRCLKELPMLNGQLRLPLRQIAEAYGCLYLRAENFSQLKAAICGLICESGRPVIMEVVSDAANDAKYLI